MNAALTRRKAGRFMKHIGDILVSKSSIFQLALAVEMIISGCKDGTLNRQDVRSDRDILF